MVLKWLQREREMRWRLRSRVLLLVVVVRSAALAFSGVVVMFAMGEDDTTTLFCICSRRTSRWVFLLLDLANVALACFASSVCLTSTNDFSSTTPSCF